MRTNDMITTRGEIRTAMQQALRDNDTDGFYQALDQMADCIGDEIKADYDNKLNGMKQEFDSRILAARGVRQLTSKERDYYQKLSEAMN